MENITQNNLQLKEHKIAVRKERERKLLLKDEKPYKCKECPAKYANWGTLHRHKNTHIKKEFSCDVCDKVYYSDASLYTHKKTHRVVLNFSGKCRNQFFL